MRRAEIYGKYSRGRGEVFEHFLLAKNIYIQKVSATPVPALKIMPIGPRENIAVIITEWLKSPYSRKKAGLEEQGFSSWLHGQLSYRSTFISRDSAPEVAKSIRRMQSRERSYTRKTVGAESRFWCFMKPSWFFLQLEVVKESNQTSHIFPKIPPLSTVCGMRKRLAKVATSAWTTLCLWIGSTKLRWRGIINSCCSSRMFMLLIAKHLHLVVHKMSKHFEDTQGRNELIKLED